MSESATMEHLSTALSHAELARGKGRSLTRVGWLAAAAACLVCSTAEAQGALGSSSARAEATYEVATRKYKEGQFEAAASLYEEAYKLAPKAPYIFNKARSLMRAFRHKEARACFARYIQLSDATERGRSRAKLHLNEIDAYQAQLHTRQRKGTLTAGLWIGSSVLIVSGGALYALALAGRAETNDRAPATLADVDDILAEQDRQSQLRWAAAGAAVVGGLGLTWALVRSLRSDRPAAVAVRPWVSGDGLTLEGRF